MRRLHTSRARRRLLRSVVVGSTPPTSEGGWLRLKNQREKKSPFTRTHPWIVLDGLRWAAATAPGVKTELSKSERCLWETQHHSVSQGVILPRKLAFVCVKRPTSPGSAFTSRDHRRWMNPPEGDKGACERLKVHTAFLH